MNNGKKGKRKERILYVKDAKVHWKGIKVLLTTHFLKLSCKFCNASRSSFENWIDPSSKWRYEISFYYIYQ